jgi:hypothetical protein
MNNGGAPGEEKPKRFDTSNKPIIKGGDHHVNWIDTVAGPPTQIAEIKEVQAYKNSNGCACTVQ